MKLLTSLSGIIILCILFTTQTHLSSCQKEPITDTVTIVKKDTVRITEDCNCYDLKDGLVAHYNFTNGDLNDLSGNNNHIIFNNATKTADRFGNAGNAYLFNGTSSYMKVANSSSLNPHHITLMAILKFNGFNQSTCHGNSVIQKGNKEQEIGFYGLRASDMGNDCNAPLDPNRVIIYGFRGLDPSAATNLPDTNIVKLNKWLTVVFTYDGTQSKLYMNGKLARVSPGSPPHAPNSNDLYFGRGESMQFPYWFNGVIDEIRIYNKALCEAEVREFEKLKE